MLPDSRIQGGKAASNSYSCLGRAEVAEPNPPQEQQAAPQGQRAHRQLGRLRLGPWKEMCTESVAQMARKGPGVSILGGLQGSATPSHGWSRSEDNLGDNSQESSLLHLKDSRVSPARLPETWHPKLPVLCAERRGRLEMSPH